MRCVCLLLVCIQAAVSYGRLIDPSTKKHTHIRRYDNKTLHLMMSDEFEVSDRRFEKGRDAFFESLDQPDFTNQAMQYYNSSAEYVTTKDGKLVIRTKAEKATWREWDRDKRHMVERTRNYTSGMVQTWNKFCFTGGVLEMSIQLPGGHANAGGLWPAAWMMGNLARATFPKSTMGIWPWSYDKCGEISHLESKQQINACNSSGEHGMRPRQGRGSPEIDIFEVMLGHTMPNVEKPFPAFMSSSLQVSPGIPKGKRPKNGIKLNDSVVWYDGIRMSDAGEFNYGFWGQECGPEIDETKEKIHKYMEDAISVNTNLRDEHFQSQHIYRLEWQPGAQGYLEWYLDDEFIMGIDADTLKLTGAMIPQEPMYLVLNTAVSHSWGFPEPCDRHTCGVCYHCYDCTNPECQCTLPDGMKNCKNLPAEMQIDYIRLYQDVSDSSHTIGCSPEAFPTEQFIEAYADRYEDWMPEQPSKETIRADFVVIIALIIVLVLAIICFGTNVCSLWRNSHIFVRRGTGDIPLSSEMPRRRVMGTPTERTSLLNDP